MKPSDDAGFTVIELLITITIMLVISSTLTGVVIVGLRTSDESEERLSESSDAQLIATYLISDLQSVGEGSVNTDPAATGCGSGGTNVLQLGWTDAAGGGSYVAAYRIAPAGTTRELTRFHCTLPGGVPQPKVLARDLHPTTNPAVTQSGRRVTIRITEDSGFVYTVLGERRTPNSTTTSSTTTTTPPLPTTSSSTSSTTSTTALCNVESPAPTASPNPVSLANGGSGHLDSAVNIVVNVSPTCGPLHLHFNTGQEAVETTVMSGTGGTRTFTIPKNTWRWTGGGPPKAITVVRANDTDVTSFPLVVNP